MKQEDDLVFVNKEIFLKRIKKGQFGKKRKKLKLASIIIDSTHTQKLFSQAWNGLSPQDQLFIGILGQEGTPLYSRLDKFLLTEEFRHVYI